MVNNNNNYCCFVPFIVRVSYNDILFSVILQTRESQNIYLI